MANNTTLAAQLGAVLKAHNLTLVLAESCTGGMVSQFITSIPGSSVWFDRAYVTYSNQSKMDLLAVSQMTLNQFGAVSEQVAAEMAKGGFEGIQKNHKDSILQINSLKNNSLKNNSLKNNNLEVDQEKSKRIVSASITGIAGPAQTKPKSTRRLNISLAYKSLVNQSLDHDSLDHDNLDHGNLDHGNLDNGNLEKPVGLVCFGFLVNHKTSTTTQHFEGTRRQIRLQATQFVIAQLITLINQATF